MLGMTWKADRTMIYAAIALVAAGFVRIMSAHDLVSGSVLVALGTILAVRVFLYFRKLERPTRREKSN
jgi:Flp pilus assembly protein TadB